ncbi:MAG: (Fe-S)-binding protein [Anaerolineae bacterium]|nr:(Fe-S)-binding protein [Anaerolineae bacterium]
MTDDLRPSPRYKPASLFVTCMIDALYPSTGVSVVEVLDHVGVAVDFPMSQTCCGQPAYNTGFWEDARAVAKQFLRAFADAQVIVTPSGSCAAMVRHEYPQLFADDPVWRNKANWAASITWEVTEYLVDGLGMTDLGAKVPPTRIAFHDACHGLRGLGLKTQARQLVSHIEGVSIHEMTGSEQCCGFGGTFSVKMAPISSAMLQEKIQAIDSVDVDVVLTGDCSCMTHINGGLSRQGKSIRTMHVIDLLAQGLRTPQGT